MATAIDPSIAPPPLGAEPGDTSLVILQSLLCLLREKGMLSRADIEELTHKIRTRAADHDHDPLPCCVQGVTKAADEMAEIDRYLGHRYGGKHRRPS
jgi:hypothetical protein